ncbi:hypothetical protein [Synechococcus sp. EJ6-Ellesmere]|uniref:hypothetical protein n=1 Tax=Synechococcus sp. EJ6-Ellesmere TaxID=2823734 RepID=UPI0020CE6157|nr:hypothetical protein [Synechococcus sp. EJ6-Ellesmere]MCP9824128.1 hypothetical protein [Synechococcus sp. EJ6-Ellesmere]
MACSPEPSQPGQLLGLVGDRDGFSHIGGVKRLRQLLESELQARGIRSRTVLAGERDQDSLRGLLVLGCSSPWAYGLVLWSRLSNPARPVVWIPCFHPPRFVRHRLRAWLAKLALRRLQFLGVEVCVLSWAERKELATVRCSVISLPFRCEPLPPRVPGREPPPPYALVFLGRPVAQKGWPKFLDLAERIGGRSLALVPCPPEGPIPPLLEVRVNATDEEVRRQLRRSRILFLPADYESFGFAQAEALWQGCCVPVLGEWPLWIGSPELDWRHASPAELAIRIEALLNNEPQRRALVRRQQQLWEHRSERREAVLPRSIEMP